MSKGKPKSALGGSFHGWKLNKPKKQNSNLMYWIISRTTTTPSKMIDYHTSKTRKGAYAWMQIMEKKARDKGEIPNVCVFGAKDLTQAKATWGFWFNEITNKSEGTE